MKNRNIFLLTALVSLLVACASIGTPDGGPYDEDPPVLVAAVPALNAVGVTNGYIELRFDENIKLNNAFDNVVVSPPQMEMPEIKYSGHKVTVQLKDSLRPNTTYSIDFGNAIVDNNEGNPYENFACVFSTGDVVDTLAVSGTVLNAQDLEPVKGVVVGLHSCLDDSAFTNTPFERVSRTDSRGRFTIKGIAPGEYRIYALNDANKNYLFDQKSEAIAFLDTRIVPFATEAVRPDTVWRDSITIDTIRYVNYTRFQPDDIVLRLFNEEVSMQYIVKYPRDDHRKFTLFFASPNDSMPLVEGLDFDFSDKYILEANAGMDTLTYWLKDSTFYRNDTLALKVTYRVTDSLGLPVNRCDTVFVAAKKRWSKVVEQMNDKLADEERAFFREARRSPDYDENNPPLFVPKTKPLTVRFTSQSLCDVDGRFRFVFEEPLQHFDPSAIHLSVQVDTVFQPLEFHLVQSPDNIREYDLFAEWRPGENYTVTVDSAAFKGVYGGVSKSFTQGLKFRTLDEYAVLYLTVPGVGDNGIVELINGQESVVKRERTDDGRCSFYFVKPGKYYLRLLDDENGNGKWDTGDFEQGVQPEKVYYYHHALDLRALFEYSQDDWDITAPLNEQKPLEITKQKPDRERRKMNRNATRRFK